MCLEKLLFLTHWLLVLHVIMYTCTDTGMYTCTATITANPSNTNVISATGSGIGTVYGTGMLWVLITCSCCLDNNVICF